ncbi:hypothetical protein [Craterilacuibacter sp. RT1T]|uniref:hypothetical protein n=1 Tax=Craterilacuibacter sp. RT1T TaxID=2942211 RepID=UPI0020BFDEF8|nr:hypothetical protein [Craterilacuibacter sp. RT1T]MCL6262183.1 hypothetical protein [Craterilacuibacter sp. RT1T]
MIRNAAIASLFLIAAVAILGAQRANEKRSASEQQLKAAQEALDTESASVRAMQKAAEASEAERIRLIERIDAINATTTARAVKLERAQRESKQTADWGRTRLPDDVAGVLNYSAEAN